MSRATTAVIDWPASGCAGDRAVDIVESGKVLRLLAGSFAMTATEGALLTSDISDGRSKNVRLDPASGALGGASRHTALLRGMMLRFAAEARALVLRLIPAYEPALQTRLVSYRPVGVAGRPVSARKDDARLHVDAFASRPNHGRRILRVFANLNPDGVPRVWNIGEPFESFARRFLPRLPSYSPALAFLLDRLHITKSRRSEYDHVMLHLHDAGKLDAEYQRSAPRQRCEFPPASMWVCFSDQVLHAALSGQFMMEQTFFLPVEGMVDPERSPLRILERLIGRPLVRRT